MTIHELLVAAGTKYRKELLTYPVLQLKEVLQYMTLKKGIQGKEVGGALTVDAELRPYRTAKDATAGPTIVPFEWETFLGDTVKEFDPHAILGTLYTESTITKADEMKIARLVALEMAKKVGEALRNAMFIAERDASGETTMDLFNGYSTLLTAAKVAEKISAAKQNYTDLTALASGPLGGHNIGTVLKEAYRKLPKVLKQQELFLYLPTSLIELYEDWFQVEHGYAPFNNEFHQKKLIGSHGKVTFAPLDNMEAQPYMLFTKKQNMLVGVDQESDKETVEIRRPDNPKVAQFFMKAYFGVGFDNLDKSFIHVAEFTTEEEEV